MRRRTSRSRLRIRTRPRICIIYSAGCSTTPALKTPSGSSTVRPRLGRLPPAVCNSPSRPTRSHTPARLPSLTPSPQATTRSSPSSSAARAQSTMRPRSAGAALPLCLLSRNRSQHLSPNRNCSRPTLPPLLRAMAQHPLPPLVLRPPRPQQPPPRQQLRPPRTSSSTPTAKGIPAETSSAANALVETLASSCTTPHPPTAPASPALGASFVTTSSKAAATARVASSATKSAVMTL